TGVLAAVTTGPGQRVPSSRPHPQHLYCARKPIGSRASKPRLPRHAGLGGAWCDHGAARTGCADLTPQATAALQAILDALGKSPEPGDLCSKWQRQHDALEEACAWPIASV
ncbi:MAG TPA: hypothetical protein VGJ07_30465, partial [Rugosimonospora sp.]